MDGGKKIKTMQTTSIGMGVVVGAVQLLQPPILMCDNTRLLKQASFSVVNLLSDTNSDWLISAYSRGTE